MGIAHKLNLWGLLDEISMHSLGMILQLLAIGVCNA